MKKPKHNAGKVAHTPGPWFRIGDRPEIFANPRKGQMGVDGICTIDGLIDKKRPQSFKQFSEAEANARLITHAPVLLEACRLAVESMEPSAARSQLLAAIAKATGGGA